MKALTLSQICAFTGGTLLSGDPEQCATAVSTDTRSLQGGELFVALTGERFDGHNFLDKAAAQGIAALLVSKPPEDLQALPCAVIQVPDTLTGLQDLARGYRRLLGIRAIGITGSNGKTTTKDLLLSVLEEKFSVKATKGNLNNHIGLPLTILSMEEEHDYGVWEMGTNHHGEIAALAAIAEPNAGIITNIGTAHIEFLQSREGIAQEKGMLAEAVGADGFFVLNANDPFSAGIAARTAAKIYLAGIEKGDVRASNLRRTPEGTSFDLSFPDGSAAHTAIPVPGDHMVNNALLAAATGFACGLSAEEIAAGLRKLRLTGGRLQRKEVDGVRFLDDSYNANPDSMKAALATLSSLECAGRRFALLGHMGELGENASQGHREVGEAAVQNGIDCLVAVGEEARLIYEGGKGVNERRWFATGEEAADFLHRAAEENDLVLVKGSRAAKMERIIELFAEMRLEER